MRWGILAGFVYLLLSLVLTLPVLARTEPSPGVDEVSVVADSGSPAVQTGGSSYAASGVVPPGAVGLMMGAGLLGLYFCASRSEARR